MPFTYSLSIVLAFLFACKKEKDKEVKAGAEANVTFQNSTALVGSRLNAAAVPTEDDPTLYTPTAFKLKIINVAVKEEKNTNKHPASMIYVNPDCESTELETSAEEYSPDVAPEDRIYYKYVGMETHCYADTISEFFDLARSEEEVNEELNSQNLPVLPSSYKYVSISFCYQDYDSEPNVLFQTEGMDEEVGLVKPGTCGLDSAEIDPPLEIEEGDQVTIKLNYTLENLFKDYGPDYYYDPYITGENVECYVSDDETVRRCVDHDLLNISATLADQ